MAVSAVLWTGVRDFFVFNSRSARVRSFACLFGLAYFAVRGVFVTVYIMSVWILTYNSGQ